MDRHQNASGMLLSLGVNQENIHYLKNRTGKAMQTICETVINPLSQCGFDLICNTFLLTYGVSFLSEIRN